MQQTTAPDDPIVPPTTPVPFGGEDLAIAPISVRISTAVKMTGLGRSKIYELIRDGALDTIKIGSATLIPVASLHCLLKKNRR